ncbi:MAG: CHASE3 domain-containing protein, partial [Proteobacteria bacterium]|nr:CHASE3 domain-containing protein [Pseudomonadota bacterium]
MRKKSQTTFREMATGLGALVAAVLAQTVIVWAVIDHLRSIDVADDEARSELQLHSRMLEAALDADIGLRGFLADRDARSLNLYQDAARRFEAAIPSLRAYTAEDPAWVRARADDVVRHADTWNETIAKPQIDIVARGGRPAWDSATDQAHIEAVRADFKVLRQFEIDELDRRAHLWNAALS